MVLGIEITLNLKERKLITLVYANIEAGYSKEYVIDLSSINKEELIEFLRVCNKLGIPIKLILQDGKLYSVYNEYREIDEKELKLILENLEKENE